MLRAIPGSFSRGKSVSLLSQKVQRVGPTVQPHSNGARGYGSMTRTRPAPGIQSQDPPWGKKMLHVADQVRNSLTIDDHTPGLAKASGS